MGVRQRSQTRPRHNMHTLQATLGGRTNRVAEEEKGHRGAKSNGVMEGDGQRPLHTAMGAGEVCRRTGKPDGVCLGRRGPGVLAARSYRDSYFARNSLTPKGSSSSASASEDGEGVICVWGASGLVEPAVP